MGEGGGGGQVTARYVAILALALIVIGCEGDFSKIQEFKGESGESVLQCKTPYGVYYVGTKIIGHYFAYLQRVIIKDEAGNILADCNTRPPAQETPQ